MSLQVYSSNFLSLENISTSSDSIQALSLAVKRFIDNRHHQPSTTEAQQQPSSFFSSFQEIQTAISTLNSLPEPQPLEDDSIDNVSTHLTTVVDLEPTIEFYHVSPKDPDTLLHWALLKSWESGRLKRWRRWHDAQLEFLVQEKQKLLRKQTFVKQLKNSNHPWMNGNVYEDALLDQVSEHEERRLRMRSDSILSSVSMNMKEQQESALEVTSNPIDLDTNNVDLMELNNQERKMAILKLAKARASRGFQGSSMNISQQQQQFTPDLDVIMEEEQEKDEIQQHDQFQSRFILSDMDWDLEQDFDCQEEEIDMDLMPMYMESNLTPEEFLIDSRHRICVEVYDKIESLRSSYPQINLKQYHRLVAKYEILLESFSM